MAHLPELSVLRAPLQASQTALHRLAGGPEALLLGKILPDPLGGKAWLQLPQHHLAEALALAPGTGSPGGRIGGFPPDRSPCL